jgi:hypothetical protein
MAGSMCIALIAAASTYLLPTDSITLRWTHTVEKTPWEEDYHVRGRSLVIEEARVKTSGAGMDAPPDARWSQGWWRYRPNLGALDEVTLANSEFAQGYTICWKGTCKLLQEFVRRGEPVSLVARRCMR